MTEAAALSTFVSPAGEAAALAAYDDVMREWPEPYDERDVTTSFGVTRVIVSGDEAGPPLVLMHAMFATATVWYPNARGLGERFRVYAVDNIGEANRSRPTRRMTTLDDYSAWFGELLDGLGIEETALVGNSYGGFLSAHLAMALPHRIRRLVLISPAATFRQIVPFYVHVFAPKALSMVLPWFPGQRRLTRHSLRWTFAGLPHDRAWTRLFYRMLLDGSTTTQVFPRVFGAEDLARIAAPTLLLVGDHERIYPARDVLRTAKERMPSIETILVPGAHHIAALAQPEIVNEHILRFCLA